MSCTNKLYFGQTIDLVHECQWNEAHIGQNMRSEINNRFILTSHETYSKIFHCRLSSQSFLFSNPKTHRTQHITRTNWINDKKSYLSTSCILCVGVRESTDWVTLQINSRDPAARCWQRGSSSFHRKNDGQSAFAILIAISIMTVPCQRSLPPYWPVWTICALFLYRYSV